MIRYAQDDIVQVQHGPVRVDVDVLVFSKALPRHSPLIPVQFCNHSQHAGLATARLTPDHWSQLITHGHDQLDALINRNLFTEIQLSHVCFLYRTIKTLFTIQPSSLRSSTDLLPLHKELDASAYNSSGGVS